MASTKLRPRNASLPSRKCAASNSRKQPRDVGEPRPQVSEEALNFSPRRRKKVEQRVPLHAQIGQLNAETGQIN
eukprot:5207680-Prymnesium_polylepis.1